MKSPVLSGVVRTVSVALFAAGTCVGRVSAEPPAGAAASAASRSTRQVEAEIREIRDSEMRGQALAELVGALAATGDLGRARKAATWIEAEEWKAQALRAIASALAAKDLQSGLAQAQAIEDDDVRCAALLDIALGCYRRGDRAAAKRILGQATETVRAGVNAYLGAGRTRMLFLQAALGDAEAALQMAERMVEPDGRATALADIAAGLAEAGEMAQAERTLRQAAELIEGIERGRFTALRSLVQALAAMGRHEEAVRLTEGIGDPRLRAEAWMAIASEGRRQEKAEAFRRLRQILEECPGEFRFGLLAPAVEAFCKAGEPEAARNLLEQASRWTEGIGETPRRVRALCATIRAGALIR